MSIQSLPDPILSLIFSHCSIRELAKIGEVCKSWKVLADSQALWKPFYWILDPLAISQESFKLTVIALVQMHLSIVKRSSEIPEELPKDTYFLPSLASEMSAWGRAKRRRFCPQIKMHSTSCLFSLIMRIFDSFIALSRVGYCTLEPAESLAKKARSYFYNPYPFNILAKEYACRGDEAKAAEMRKIRNLCTKENRTIEN